MRVLRGAPHGCVDWRICGAMWRARWVRQILGLKPHVAHGFLAPLRYWRACGALAPVLALWRRASLERFCYPLAFCPHLAHTLCRTGGKLRRVRQVCRGG